MTGDAMPVYIYEIIKRGGKSGGRFEIFQKMTEKPLKKHPKTGEPVRRVFLAPNTPQNRYDKTVKRLSKQDKPFANMTPLLRKKISGN